VQESEMFAELEGRNLKYKREEVKEEMADLTEKSKSVRYDRRKHHTTKYLAKTRGEGQATAL